MTVHQATSGGTPDPKRPYGGLVPSQPKGTRAYTDAASYNQHLAQHQAYTAQAQSQAANTFRNPYITPQNAQSHPPSNTTYNSTSESAYPPQQQQQQQPPLPSQQSQQHPQYISNPPSAAHRGLTHQNSTGQLATTGSNSQFPSNHGNVSTMGAAQLSTNVPANPYVPNSRARANTINQMDVVPPALARLQHMNQDIIGGRNALTPVLNRDDAMREWERRQAGKAAAAQPYPQLEYLQQQAEMVASSGLSNWSGGGSTNAGGIPSGPQQRYPPPPSKLSHAYQPQTIMVDDDAHNRRDAVMSNVRSAARSDGQNAVYGGQGVIASPPQAYGSNAQANNRYPTNFSQNQATSNFETIDRRNDIGGMYVPMQPEQYTSYSGGPPPQSARHNIQPGQNVPNSFYGASVLPTGQINTAQTRNPFQLADGPQQQTATVAKDVRRVNNGIDSWQQR